MPIDWVQAFLKFNSHKREAADCFQYSLGGAQDVKQRPLHGNSTNDTFRFHRRSVLEKMASGHWLAHSFRNGGAIACERATFPVT
jgi:hypothetical protein